jgi:hypothetical protein
MAFVVLSSSISLGFSACSHQVSEPILRSVEDNKKDSTSYVLTNEQKIFRCIFEKYPGNYFRVGSAIGFHKDFDAKSDKRVFDFCYYVVDSTKSDERKYLKEIKDSILGKYLPSTHFYFGRKSCHPEVGEYADLLYYLHNDVGDLVFDKGEFGFNAEFVNIIKGVIIPGKAEKEKFASALSNIFAPGLIIYFGGYTKIRTILAWSGDKLTVTEYYKTENETEISTNLYVYFKGDNISFFSSSNSYFIYSRYFVYA